MWGLLAGSVLKQDGVDELFENYYESNKKRKFSLVPEYVKSQSIMGTVDKMNKKQRNKSHQLNDEFENVIKDQKKERFRRRIVREEKKGLLNRLQLIIRLRIIEGPLIIVAMLEVIKIQKNILVLNLEQGQETLIPPELGQKHLPLSFQYYDSIFEIIRQRITPE